MNKGEYLYAHGKSSIWTGDRLASAALMMATRVSKLYVTIPNTPYLPFLAASSIFTARLFESFSSGMIEVSVWPRLAKLVCDMSLALSCSRRLKLEVSGPQLNANEYLSHRDLLSKHRTVVETGLSVSDFSHWNGTQVGQTPIIRPRKHGTDFGV